MLDFIPVEIYEPIYYYTLLLVVVVTFVHSQIKILGTPANKSFTNVMGFFTQARKLEEVASTSISNIVNQVSYPVLAEVQNDKNRMISALEKLIVTISFASFPLMILLIVSAEPLIKLLYSDRWLNSVPYFRILCVAGIAISIQGINYYAVASIGKSKEIFKWTIIKRTLNLLYIIAGFKLFDIYGLLWGMVLGSFTIYITNAYLTSKYVGYKLFKQLKDLTPIIFISLISGGVTYFLGLQIHDWLISLFTMIASYILIYFSLSYLFKLDAFFTIRSILSKSIDKYKK